MLTNSRFAPRGKCAVSRKLLLVCGLLLCLAVGAGLGAYYGVKEYQRRGRLPKPPTDWVSFNRRLEKASPTGSRYSADAPHARLVSDVTPPLPTRPDTDNTSSDSPAAVAGVPPANVNANGLHFPGLSDALLQQQMQAQQLMRARMAAAQAQVQAHTQAPVQAQAPATAQTHAASSPAAPAAASASTPPPPPPLSEWERATFHTLPAMCDTYFPLASPEAMRRAPPNNGARKPVVYLTTPLYFPGFNSVRLQVEQHSYLAYRAALTHVTNWVVPDNHNRDKGGGLLTRSQGLYSIWSYFDRAAAERVTGVVDVVADAPDARTSSGEVLATSAITPDRKFRTAGLTVQPLSTNALVVEHPLPDPATARGAALHGFVQRKAITYQEQGVPNPLFDSLLDPNFVLASTDVLALTRVFGENNFVWPDPLGAVEYNCFVLRAVRPNVRLRDAATAISARLNALAREDGTAAATSADTSAAAAPGVSLYHSYQMRRTDYGDPQSTEAIAGHLRRLQVIPDGAVLYIATDSRKPEDLAPFRAHWRVYTLADFKDLLPAPDTATADTAVGSASSGAATKEDAERPRELVNDHLMLIEQLVCAAADVFLGTHRSSVTEGVLKYRTVVPYSTVEEGVGAGLWHVFDPREYHRYRPGAKNIMTQFLPKLTTL